MAVSVYVMPLGTWLTGSFQPTWGEGKAAPPSGPRLRDEDAARRLETFKDDLEGLLAVRPDWDEDGPARTAGVFSAEGFATPFLLARRWSYRLRLPRLASLEPPAILLPLDFDPVFHVRSPWAPDNEVMVASIGKVLGELERLLAEDSTESSVEEQREIEGVHRIAKRLQGIFSAGAEYGVPVILDG